MLAALILALGPASGAHLNPAVTHVAEVAHDVVVPQGDDMPPPDGS